MRTPISRMPMRRKKGTLMKSTESSTENRRNVRERAGLVLKSLLRRLAGNSEFDQFRGFFPRGASNFINSHVFWSNVFEAGSVLQRPDPLMRLVQNWDEQGCSQSSLRLLRALATYFCVAPVAGFFADFGAILTGSPSAGLVSPAAGGFGTGLAGDAVPGAGGNGCPDTPASSAR